MADDYNDLPTARTTLQTGYVRRLLTCGSCCDRVMPICKG